jgi:ABC-type sugar transport system permease subunit
MFLYRFLVLPIWLKVIKPIGRIRFVRRLGHFIARPFRYLKLHLYSSLTYQGQKVVWSFIFLLPVILGFILFFIKPLFESLKYSFSYIEFTQNGINILFGGFLNKDGAFVRDLFYNYKQALTVHPTFLVELFNTFKNTAIDVVVITIFSLMVAVMLNGKFKGRGIVRAIFFLPVIFNSEAINQAITKSAQVDALLNQMGNGALSALFNLEMFLTGAGIPAWLITFLTSITGAIYRTISYSGIQILIFLAAIQSVPTHLYEAAKIEGATKYESFWKITLPMVSPMIMTVVFYTIVDSFMRSSINSIINAVYLIPNYGLHAAMLWLYMGASIILLGVFMFLLSKVVFYYDEK